MVEGLIVGVAAIVAFVALHTVVVLAISRLRRHHAHGAARPPITLAKATGFGLLYSFLDLTVLVLVSFSFKSSPPYTSTLSPSTSALPWPTETSLHDPVAPSPFELISHQLVRGELGYDVPKEMTQGTPVNVQVSVGTVEEALRHAFKDPSQVVTKEQILSTVVYASLYGGGFTVTPLSSTRQTVIGSSPTTWRFSVLPTDDGDKQLTLIVGAELTVDGHPVAPEEYTTDTKIAVKVNRVWMAKHFVTGNWQYLCSAAVLPIIGVVWSSLRKKKKPDGGFARNDD